MLSSSAVHLKHLVFVWCMVERDVGGALVTQALTHLIDHLKAWWCFVDLVIRYLTQQYGEVFW